MTWIAAAFVLAQELTPREEYEQKLAECYSTMADVLCDLGIKASRPDQHGWAAILFERAIHFNPQHAQAREKLGYTLVNGEWQPHVCPSPPCRHISRSNTLQGEDAARAGLLLSREWERKGQAIARKWKDLATFAQRNGMEAEAVKAWRQAADYDPNQREARRALGFTQARERGNIWLTAPMTQLLDRMQTHRDAQASGFGSAPAGADRTEATPVEQGMQLPMRKRESEHFLLESPHLDPAEVTALLQIAEHASLMYKDLFSLQQVAVSQQANYILLETKEQHQNMLRWLQSQGMVAADPRWMEMAMEAGGLNGVLRAHSHSDSTSEARKDWVVHVATHTNYAFHLAGGGGELSRGGPAWLDEGLAFYFSIALLGSTGSSCTNLTETRGNVRGAPQRSEEWAGAIKRMVMEMWDPPLLEVIGVDTGELYGVRTIKAWSLVDWLIHEHREKFAQFISELSRNPEDRGEAAFRTAFDWTVDDADERWRQYVRQTYP